MICNKQCEVYSRVVGYHNPVQHWNIGKKEEFKERKEFKSCYDCKLDTGEIDENIETKEY